MSYHKWISVNLEHRYFADHRCPPVRFEPTEECRKQMRLGRLFFYPGNDGFQVFKDNRKIHEHLTPSTGKCFFDIAVYSIDGLLGNYSNLDIDYRGGRVYYIGGPLQPPPGENKPHRLTLSDGEGKEEIEAVPVLLRPGQCVIPLEEASPGDIFELVNRNNMVVKEKQVTAQTTELSLYLDTAGKRGGLYRLERNGRAAAYVYADDALYRSRPDFIIGLENRARQYHLRIAGRAVPWQYHVVARANGRKLKNLGIRNNNEKLLPGVSFERTHIDEPNKEVVFLSNKPLPLFEKGIQSIELIENGNNGAPLVPHLPNAGIASLHVKEGRWVAQIYVYI